VVHVCYSVLKELVSDFFTCEGVEKILNVKNIQVRVKLKNNHCCCTRSNIRWDEHTAFGLFLFDFKGAVRIWSMVGGEVWSDHWLC